MNLEKEDAEKVALARYSIVKTLEACRDEYVTDKALFEYGATLPYEIGEKPYPTVSWHTVRRWYKNYEKGGFEALIPTSRNDKGTARKLDDDLKQKIQVYLETNPKAPATSVYRALIEEQAFLETDLSLSTVRRYVMKYRKEAGSITQEDKRRYELASVNAVWYGDTLRGPSITVEGEKKKTYVIILIDDASRLVVGYGAYFHDDTASLALTMAQAVEKYGVPNLFVFDNGSNYRSHNIKTLAARMKTIIHYCKPYEPTQKAKVERFNKTLRSQFLSTIPKDRLETIESFNDALTVYIRNYNSSNHSSLGMSPNQRYFSDPAKRQRISPEELEKQVYLDDKRKSTADRLIKLNNTDYEIPVEFADQQVRIRYKPDYSHVWVMDDNDKLIEVFEVDKVENAYSGRISLHTGSKTQSSETGEKEK